MSKLILNALIKAQHSIQNPIKDGKNPHFRNTYASINSVLEAVKEHLLECNIYIYQTMGRDELGDFVSTTLYHTDGDTLDCGKIYLRFKKDDMQQLGSAITYARRYSLQALFGLGADDDDGEASMNRRPIEARKPQSNPIVKEWFKPVEASMDKQNQVKELLDLCRILSEKHGWSQDDKLDFIVNKLEIKDIHKLTEESSVKLDELILFVRHELDPIDM